jgi:pimeloyl-ACP methyl ester carboxylesterase
MDSVITRDKTRLYVKDWGSGKPVILLHGWPLSADSWDDQAMAIAQAGYRAIAYDRRGFGRSTQPWTGYDYDTLADDLAMVIEQAGARDVTLVGFSMGGGEVARYMSRHRGNGVIKAALVSSVVPFLLQTTDNPGGTPESVFEEMSHGMRTDRARFFTGFFKSFFGNGLVSHPVSEEVLQWAQGLALQASLKATLDCAKSFASTDFRADLAAFKVPTLVIHGADDKTVPIGISGKLAAAGIANSTFLTYEGAPHGLFATHKDRLSRDLLEFLR